MHSVASNAHSLQHYEKEDSPVLLADSVHTIANSEELSERLTDKGNSRNEVSKRMLMLSVLINTIYLKAITEVSIIKQAKDLLPRFLEQNKID